MNNFKFIKNFNYKKIVLSLSLLSLLGCTSLKDTAETVAGVTLLTTLYTTKVLIPAWIDNLHNENTDNGEQEIKIKPVEYTYYDGGQIKTKSTYKKPTLIVEIYRPDGIKVEEKTFDVETYGHYLTYTKSYWSNGFLKKEVPPVTKWDYENPNLYYPNGQPKEVNNISYNPNGKPYSNYGGGSKAALEKSPTERKKEGGNFKLYFKNNKLAAEENYSNGMKNGRFTIYTTKGVLVSDMTYKNDKIVGKAYTYFPDGKLCSVTPYVNGLKDGKSTEYYKDGKIISETNYSKGYKHGIEKVYHFNGNIFSVTKYNYNTVENQTFYDYNGKLIEKPNN